MGVYCGNPHKDGQVCFAKFVLKTVCVNCNLHHADSIMPFETRFTIVYKVDVV
jgi:hypothetical protein